MDIETKELFQSLLNAHRSTITVLNNQQKQIQSLMRLFGHTNEMINAIVASVTSGLPPAVAELSEKAKREIEELERLSKLEPPPAE